MPGCATGEEAYSIAIVAAEQVAAAQSACRVQVFATDVDEHALEIARAGVYPESIALDVTPQRLTRFFTRGDHRYTIAESIRESVVFAVQNVIERSAVLEARPGELPKRADLPGAAQSRSSVMAVFHFALNPGGYLFLGNAESVGRLDEWFRRYQSEPDLPDGSEPRSVQPLDFPRPQPAQWTASHGGRGAEDRINGGGAGESRLAGAPRAGCRRRQPDRARWSICYGAMDRYIHLPTGEATLDVLSVARDR